MTHDEILQGLYEQTLVGDAPTVLGCRYCCPLPLGGGPIGL